MLPPHWSCFRMCALCPMCVAAGIPTLPGRSRAQHRRTASLRCSCCFRHCCNTSRLSRGACCGIHHVRTTTNFLLPTTTTLQSFVVAPHQAPQHVTALAAIKRPCLWVLRLPALPRSGKRGGAKPMIDGEPPWWSSKLLHVGVCMQKRMGVVGGVPSREDSCTV